MSNDFATSAGHWYEQDGTPRYTITGKNGRERNTTLADARKLNLVPSVTTIIRMAAAPSLERWKRNQVLLSALTLPRKEGESETDWLARVEQDWQEQGRAAADRGTAIHGAIERHYRGEAPTDEELWPWVRAASDAIDAACGPQAWSAERSFAHPLGYGGKVDLHSAEWVIDVKTKDGPLDSTTLYDEHLMQLAAYRNGLMLLNPRCGILFVGRDNPAAVFVEAERDDINRGLMMFMALLEYWQYKTGHNVESLGKAA